MTSMTSPTTRIVIGGVDTHGHTHHAAVIDKVGRQLGDREFTASPAGYRALAAWLSQHGTLTTIGVEGTGTYGAGLARYLRTIGLTVVEVDRPDRKSRRAHAKSDPLDAYAAAKAVLSGSAAGVPKLRDGRVEAIRALRVARSSAVKARSQATNQIKALIITGPAELREQLRHLPTHKIIASCARLRPGRQLGDPAQATKTALRRLARRHQHLSEEISRSRPRPRPTGRCGRARPARPSRCRTRGRRPTPHQRRRQPRPDHLRSRVRPPMRRRAGPGQQRPHPPTPTQPKRRPPRQQRPLHRRAQPAPPRPPQPRLRRAPHPRRTLQTRDHQMPETLRRPRDLQHPHHPQPQRQPHQTSP